MNNRIETWPTHSDVRFGSSREVEAAGNIVVPPHEHTSSCGCASSHPDAHRSMPERTSSMAVGMKARGAELASHLKSRSIETVDTLRREMRERAAVLKREMSTRREQTKRSMARAQVTARENVALQRDRMKGSMRTQPMKWAGIAAGSGVVLGLLGRHAHWRKTRPAPQVVVIESCS